MRTAIGTTSRMSVSNIGSIDARQTRSRDDLLELQRSAGEKISAHWISYRERRMEWVNTAVSK